MAYWRNEQVVYGEDDDNDASFVMPTIKEVIRADEVEPVKGRPRATASKRKARQVESEAEDDPLEAWETEEGVVKGLVRECTGGEAGDVAAPQMENGQSNFDFLFRLA